MNNSLRSNGIMLILSSPSGAGKSSITKALIQEDRNTRLSISATTRQQRPGEIDGTDYHFLNIEKFDTLVSQNAFLEHAEVFGNQYGTLVSEVEPYLAKGIDVIFDVDWQGAQKLRHAKVAGIISVYILPPSLGALKERLAQRKQDNEDIINRRMQGALQEISHYHEYDYIIVNDQLHDAIQTVKSILQSERVRKSRLDLLDNFVKAF